MVINTAGFATNMPDGPEKSMWFYARSIMLVKKRLSIMRGTQWRSSNVLSGEVRAAQIFVAVMGASNYTYAEATWSQSLPDWISSHVNALHFFGGVPGAIVPDNLKSGVTKPCYYEPEINPTYQEMAGHYGTVILPARVRKPRDKAKVETGVQIGFVKRDVGFVKR